MIKKRVSFKIAILVGIVEIIAMFLLFLVMNHNLTEILTAKAISDMDVIARDRAQLVESYINDCCDFLSGYSRATEIREVLENSSDSGCLKAAAEYTNRYAEGYNDIEGLYTAEWNTYVLTHINPDSVNQTFRDAKSAKALENLIKANTMPFCTGIVQAPVTKKMVIPVYAPVYDKSGNAIGFAGAAFFSDNLSDSLDKLTDSTSSHTGYALINADNNLYIFNDDPELVGTECTDPELLNAVVALSTGAIDSDSYDFSSDGYLTSCYYMFNRNWIFVIKDSNEDVFGVIRKVRLVILLICVFITLAMVFICVFSVEQQMKPLKVINTQIEKLKTGDYSHDNAIKKYRGREDEFGSISNAVAELHLVLENQYELFLDVFEAQTAGTLVTDAEDDNIIMVNDTALYLYGIDPSKKENITIQDIRDHFTEEELQNVFKKREEAKNSTEEITFESTVKHDDGSIVHILSHCKAVTLSNGETVVIFSIMDISARKMLEENLLILSETDALTSICNRRSGEKKIENLLSEGVTGVFCLFDVNKFKHVNDTYGHTAGDHVLIAIANTMKKTFRNSDVLMRLGGDEFVVFATNIESEDIATNVLNRFLNNISNIDLPEIAKEKITISLGAVLVSENEPFSQMYAKADSLMYDCKKKGGNAFIFYK